MAQDPTSEHPQNGADGKTTRQTTTLSVRLPLEQANTLRAQAAAKKYKNVNQYLIAMIDLIAPLVPEAPTEQAHEQTTPKPKPSFED